MALDWQDVFLKSMFCIGFIALGKRFLNLVTWLYTALFRSPKDLTSYGSWAVVTGCTDGIGKALALELAKKGLNMILVGRNRSKLEATTAEIRQLPCKCGGGNGIIKTRSILVDLAEMRGEEIERRIKEGIEGLDVGLLINNAGMAYPSARFFHEVDLKLMEGVMRVNADGATWVTRAVLPGMLDKGKGAIVNVGSGSAVCLPSYPLYTVYSATKAYLAMFSRSLSSEYQKLGIDIQCQVPFLVATKMASIRKSSLFIRPRKSTAERASGGWERAATPACHTAHIICNGVSFRRCLIRSSVASPFAISSPCGPVGSPRTLGSLLLHPIPHNDRATALPGCTFNLIVSGPAFLIWMFDILDIRAEQYSV